MWTTILTFHLVLYAVIITATRWEPGDQRKIPRKWKQHANVDDVGSRHAIQDVPYWNLDPEQEPEYQPDYQLTSNPSEDLANEIGHRRKNRKRQPIRTPIRFHRWPNGIQDQGDVRNGQGQPSQKEKDDLESKWDIMLSKVSASIKSRSKSDSRRVDVDDRQRKGKGSWKAVRVSGVIKPDEVHGMARIGPNTKDKKTLTLGIKPNASAANETLHTSIPLFSLITAGHCWKFQYRWLLLGLCLSMYTVDAIFIVVIVHKFYVEKKYKHFRFGGVKSTGDLCDAIRSLDYDAAELLSKSLFLRLKSRPEPDIMKRYFGGDKDELAEGINFTALISDLKRRPRLFRRRRSNGKKKRASSTPTKDNLSHTYLSARDMVSDDEESIFERETFLPPFAVQRRDDSDFDN